MSNKIFDINTLVRANVARLKPYSSARDEYKSTGNTMIFLDANENPNDNGLNRYPDPQQRKVKEELAKLKGILPSQILFGNGSDEVLDLIYRAFCEPYKDNVITLPPTYGMYQVLAETNAVENREVLLTDDFQPNVEAILNKVDEHTKMIFLCSPNNPTGNLFDADKIEKLLSTFSGLIVIDEAYIDFADTTGWLSRLYEYPNLILTQTFSKAYGMAGIRLGVCYASAEIIAILNKIKPPYNINEITQLQALKRLSEPELVVREISSILAERKKLKEGLTSIAFVSKIYPTDANFILIKVDDATARYNQLLEKGIVIRNRTTQPLCENTLRLTVGTQTENNNLLEALIALQ